MISKIKNSIMGHKKKSILVLVILLLVGFKVFKQSSNLGSDFVVSKKDVIQSVIVTGKVKPREDVTLSFERTGRVSKVSADVGSKVFVGQVLVGLDSSVEYADYLKAKANLEAERANLDDLKNGYSEEEIALYETEVSNAKNNLQNAKNNILNKLKDAFVKSDDAVRNNIDQLFSNPKSSNPQINIEVSNIQLKNDINQSRFQIESTLNAWSQLDNSVFIKENISKTLDALNKMQTFTDKVSSAVNALQPNSGLSQTIVDAYKTSVSNSRTNINTAINNLWSAQDNLNSAESALAIAERNLVIKKKGATQDEIRAQEAKVLQYEALVSSSEATLSKMTLRSPINGIVVKQDANLGEIITSGSQIVSVISENNFQIESNVSEVSIGKVKVGDPVYIKMDAYPDRVFVGNVVYIEPGETLVDGVVNFKVKVAFSEEYSDIKTGLTANLDIETEKVSNVLAVPQYAISLKDGKNYVSLKVGKKQIEEREVSLGLFGNDGFVEVLSGLTEGDVIVLSQDKK